MSSQSLTFEKFRVWQVVVPARQDIVSAAATPGVMYRDSGKWPQMPIHLVAATTSQGIVAVGESGRGATRAAVAELLGRYVQADSELLRRARQVQLRRRR